MIKLKIVITFPPFCVHDYSFLFVVVVVVASTGFLTKRNVYHFTFKGRIRCKIFLVEFFMKYKFYVNFTVYLNIKFQLNSFFKLS